MATTDYQSFARTYGQYSALVWSIVLRFVKNEGEAEDVMIDVFVRLYADGICQSEPANKQESVIRITYVAILNHMGRQRFREGLMLEREMLAVSE